MNLLTIVSSEYAKIVDTNKDKLSLPVKRDIVKWLITHMKYCETLKIVRG